MLDFYIDNGLGTQVYTQYVGDQTVKIEDGLNVPTLLSLTLFNNDNNFTVPVRNAYITIISRKSDKVLFSGFITQTPQASYLGVGSNVPAFNFERYAYSVVATSDEWLLNVKSVPFIPAFVNQTMGQILSVLAAALLPNYFDTTSHVDAGDLIPYYEYNPAQTWAEIAKTFADAARYRYKVINRTVWFKPYNDMPLGIDYDDSITGVNFDPSTLQTQPLQVPIVNDAIIIGDIEPQNIRRDYFIGDGASANFPLTHRAFRGATALLLKEDWSGSSFATDLWNVIDPTASMTLNGALYIAGGTGTLGESYILGNNGLEIGGALNIQHGEIQFNDTCTGMIGGLYASTTLTGDQCQVGFDVRPSTSVVVTASGAGGIYIQPWLDGALYGDAITSKVNHHYQLQTLINAPQWTRYNQIFRSLGGSVYGGDSNTVTVNVTWLITEIDMNTFTMIPNPLIPITGSVVSRTTTTIQLPAFMVYAPVNYGTLNLLMNFTLIAQPPQGTLQVSSLIGPTGSQQPIVTPGDPMPYLLGFGQQNQTATIGQQGEVDVLQFYQDSIPAVGARIAIQTWEAGYAVARVQQPISILAEQVTFGDDGIRSIVMHDLTPLPRTSMECELAAKALLVDRTQQQYNGSYMVDDWFWNPFSSESYPITGRYLPVNSPRRNITNQNFLVRRIITQVKEIMQEKLQFSIEFGQDLYLSKFMRQFVTPSKPLLLPRDAATRPIPQAFNAVGTTYLANLADAQIVAVSGGDVTIDLGAPPVTGCEIRRVDTGWGRNDQNRIALTGLQSFTLSRSAVDQLFYLRQLNEGVFSRVSTVLRVNYPLIPSVPLAPTFDLSDPLHPTFTLGLNGDIRNIRGIQIRDADNVTVLADRTFLTLADLTFTFDNTVDLDRSFTYYCYFYNLQYEYSTAVVLTGTVAVPPTPIVTVLNAMAKDINIQLDVISRPDITYAIVEMADDTDFTDNLIHVRGGATQSVYALHVTNPPGEQAIRTQYIRAKRADTLGESDWSDIVTIDIDDILSSGWLSPQGSIPPIITSRAANLFTYVSTDSTIVWSWSSFTVRYPDGEEQTIAAGSYPVFTGLVASSTYLFYPYISQAYQIAPPVIVAISTVSGGTGSDPVTDGVRTLDGNVPLSINGPMTASTTSGGGSGGGGGGGIEF